MKDWQFGIELSALEEIASFYDRHNKYALSPFSQVKKHTVARMMNRHELVEVRDTDLKIPIGYYRAATSRAASKIEMFPNLVIAAKEKGDETISNIACIEGCERFMVDSLARTYNVFATCFEEDRYTRDLLRAAGFYKIGTKYTSFAEIVGVYYRSRDLRYFPEIAAIEKVNVARCDKFFFKDEADSIKKKLENMYVNYAVHYSNYNIGDCWSGVALRGFFSDFRRIEKPAEMNEDYFLKHPDAHDAKIANTEIYEAFKTEIEAIINAVASARVERIRLLNLAPSDAGLAKEIARHSDIVDRESGPKTGQLARLHLPIKTNDHVYFHSWDDDGFEDVVQMQQGELWYLDTRRPHRVVNRGDSNRVHLVIDCEMTDALQKDLIESKARGVY